MQAIEAIKAAAQQVNMPTTHIGPALGLSRAYVATMATKGTTPKADTLAAVLETCGYALAAVPVDDLPPSALRIDSKG